MGNIRIGLDGNLIIGAILAAMRQRSRVIEHRAGIAPINVTAAPLPQRLTEQNSAFGVHDCPALPIRKMACFRDRPILERTPNVKADPCFCVCLYGHVLGFSPGRTPRDSAGAAGVLARRFALLPKTTGRRYGGPAVPAAEPAKTEFCLSKGIPEPRPIAGAWAARSVAPRVRHARP